MAKRKKRSSEKEKKKDYVYEIYGIFLILLSILGMCKYGIVGRALTSFSLFLFGCLYFVFFIILLSLGIYVIFKREFPNLFNSKFIGIYLVVIGLLVYVHLKFVTINLEPMKILSETKDNLFIGINNVMNREAFDSSLAGGGMVGALFATLFYKLFELKGTEIVVIVFIVSGILIFTGLSIVDIIKNIYNKGKDIIPNSKHDKEDRVSNKEKRPLIVDNNNHDESKKVVSLQELTHGADNKDNSSLPKEEVVINKSYQLPSMDLLNPAKKNKNSINRETIERNIETIENVLKDFGIMVKVIEVNIGPTVTQYEMEWTTGTKVSRLLSLNKEISLALAKKDVRIQAPIPGKNTVGIELPNEVVQPVSLREILENMPKQLADNPLAVALGKNIMGKIEFCEINKTPHLLVAGSTGSGKSVCINCMIVSLLMRNKPSEVKLVLIDPKKVEFSIYNGIPHLLTPVVNDPKKAAVALRKIVNEMERRYDIFSETGCKNIESYNTMIVNKNKNLPEEDQMQKLPYVVAIVDELADLMIVAGKEVEDCIMRITQMARAAGIHLIIATQRPSTDIITGVIKNNIPSRISFAVSSSIDSRTILDMMGAEKLIGRGDMLVKPMGENTPTRVQGAYLSEEEIDRVVKHTIKEQKAQYDESFLNLNESVSAPNAKQERQIQEQEEYDDPLYNEIVEFVVTSGKASASLLQRRFKLGYNRAARIIDLLEERGIIGPVNGSKPREVLVKLDKTEDIDD